MEKQFYDFRKLKSKIETFGSIFFFPPSHYLSTRSWIKSIARRPFSTEFKSFYNSAIQSNWESKEEWKKFLLFIFINITMLKGNFLSLETSLSGEIEWNKLFLWFLDRWERCNICVKYSGTNWYNYRTDYRNLEWILKNKHSFKYYLQRLLNTFALKYQLCIIIED